MSRRADAGPAQTPSATVARLEAMRRLSMGATHALNNAFTTLVGEASFLCDDRKDDPVVTEACDAMLGELERCSALTRALLARRHPSQRGAGEVDLVRLVRELGSLLQETLGRQHELVVEAPDDLVLVAGEADDLELLVLVLVHYAADGAEGGACLRLAVEAPSADGQARLSLEVRGSGWPADAEAAFAAPAREADPVHAAGLEALAGIVDALGGSRHAARTAPDAWTARIALPALA